MGPLKEREDERNKEKGNREKQTKQKKTKKKTKQTETQTNENRCKEAWTRFTTINYCQMLRIQYVNFIDKILMFREHFNNKNSLTIGHLP